MCTGTNALASVFGALKLAASLSSLGLLQTVCQHVPAADGVADKQIQEICSMDHTCSGSHASHETAEAHFMAQSSSGRSSASPSHPAGIPAASSTPPRSAWYRSAAHTSSRTKPRHRQRQGADLHAPAGREVDSHPMHGSRC